MYVTSRLDLALRELLDSSFDCLLIEEPADRNHLRLLVATASLVSDALPVVWRGQPEPVAAAAVTDDVDLMLGPDEPIELDELAALRDEAATGVDGDRHPVVASLHHDHPERAIGHLDRDGTFLWANDRLAALADARPDDLRGASVGETFPDRSGHVLSELVAVVAETARPQWAGSIGAASDHRCCLLPLADDTVLFVTHVPEAVVGFGGQYLDRLTELFFVVDTEGRFIYWNEAANEVTGYTDDELLGMTALDLFTDEDREQVRSELDDIDAGSEKTAEFTVRTKAGDEIPYQFSASAIDAPDGAQRIVCGIGRDISRRVEMRREIETAIEDLEASNEELERFAYVASHDLREPLRMVRSYLQLLQRRHGDRFDEEATEFIEFAVDGAERMRSMIEDLLAYSRVGIEVRQERVDCDAVLEEVQENLGVAIAESNAEITVDPLPTVPADRTLLIQLFQNLLGNAIEHAEDSPPRIHVSADRARDKWEFKIRDWNGGLSGVDEEEVFQLFTSGNEGAGMGLAICRKIVETFDGEIDVESEPGVGTTFSVTLPATTDE